MLHPGDAIDGADEGPPAGALGGEDLAPLGRQPIHAAAPRVGALDPAPFQPAELLEAVEERIQRRRVKPERPLGSPIDELRDFVAVPGAIFDEGKDQQLRTALLHLPRTTCE